MAEVSQDQFVEYIKGISVLELSQLVKRLESELGVSAAAAAPVMVAGWRRRGGGGGSGGREDRVHGRPHRSRHQQDQRDQGRPRSDEPRPEGSEGPRRGRAEAGQGRRQQGRSRGHQEEVRGSRREGRSQVARPASLSLVRAYRSPSSINLERRSRRARFRLYSVYFSTRCRERVRTQRASHAVVGRSVQRVGNERRGGLMGGYPRRRLTQ